MAINYIIYSATKYNPTPCICAAQMGPMNCKQSRTTENQPTTLHVFEGLESPH